MVICCSVLGFCCQGSVGAGRLRRSQHGPLTTYFVNTLFNGLCQFLAQPIITNRVAVRYSDTGLLSQYETELCFDWVFS